LISERELRRIAGRSGLGAGQAEHEYVVACALDALAQAAGLARSFCLKGGTALRQLYFSDWRHSVDLDFSVLPGYSESGLRADLDTWFAVLTERHGVQAAVADYHRANGAARLRARYLGPLRHPARLLIDITLDEPVLLPVQHRPIVTGLFPEIMTLVPAYALEEILAEKLRSILQRARARDYYDAWRLLGEKASFFDASEARRVFLAKCQHKGIMSARVGDFLAPDRLSAVSPYWQQDLAAQVLTGQMPELATVLAELPALLAAFLGRGPWDAVPPP
jgi:uncharacterized protein